MATMMEWLDEVKAEAQSESDEELMMVIDTLYSKVPKSAKEAKALDLMKQVYEYELQKRLWTE